VQIAWAWQELPLHCENPSIFMADRGSVKLRFLASFALR
jgi:hypothetical protein